MGKELLLMKKSEYKKLAKATQKEFDKLQKIAQAAVVKAQNLSVKTGVPFSWYSEVGSGAYFPETLPDFDAAFLSEVTDFDESYFEEEYGNKRESGWLSSYC